MDPFQMVVAIVVVVTIGRVLQARYGVRRDWRGNEYSSDRDNGASAAENARLRDEVRTLKDRVQVLERVITDNNSSMRLDQEIEKLRNKDNA